jgi:hypothetical protein
MGEEVGVEGVIVVKWGVLVIVVQLVTLFVGMDVKFADEVKKVLTLVGGRYVELAGGIEKVLLLVVYP